MQALLEKHRPWIEKHLQKAKQQRAAADSIAPLTAEELRDQYPFFAGHRHDQSILTPLAASDSRTLVLPEVSEAYRPDSFVWASRVRARNVREYLVVQVKHYLRIWLGDERFEKLKRK